MKAIVSVFTIMVTLATACVPTKRLDTTMPEISYLDRAQYQRQKGDIDEAVKLYRAHIDSRLKKVDRLREEDPNYYLIVIGDLYFDSKRVEEAYATYQEAEQRGVAKNFVVDRYVRVARWYASKRNFAMAECILMKHSFLDPLVFEGELDQSYRKHTAAEDLAGKKLRGRTDICDAPEAQLPLVERGLVAPLPVIR